MGGGGRQRDTDATRHCGAAPLTAQVIVLQLVAAQIVGVVRGRGGGGGGGG